MKKLAVALAVFMALQTLMAAATPITSMTTTTVEDYLIVGMAPGSAGPP